MTWRQVLSGAAVPLACAFVMIGTASAASPADTITPAGAGVTGIVVITGSSGGINTAPGIVGGSGINTSLGLPNAPAGPRTVVLTPTPTGSLVVPVTPSAPSTGAPTGYRIIVPGPNPSQNTSVALSQMLSTLLSPPGGQTPVAVYTVPPTVP